MNLPAMKLKSRQRPAVALHDRAMDNLRYIRETMERSASFTHVSGIGGVATGLIALAAAAAAAGVAAEAVWLSIWLGAAALSFLVSLILMARKSRAEGVSLLSGPARRFAWSMIPALAAGAVLTGALARAGLFDLLPATWLLLYGASVVTGGSHSVRPVPLMGASFMVAGALAVVSPPAWGNAYMAAAFGGLHMVFGIVIWRKHGG
jgi:predicted membrane channel-forming protein YqfA (hemolysin III family)